MKKLHITFLVVLSLLMGCSKSSKEQVNSTGANDQPDMLVTLTDNSTVNMKDLTGKNVLIFFQPDCDHCQREATDFEKNLKAFEACSIYFLTAAPMQDINEFSAKYNLTGHTNVRFGYTPAKNILDHYGAIAAPSIYIYSEEHKLIKYFNGEISVDEVKKFI